MNIKSERTLTSESAFLQAKSIDLLTNTLQKLCISENAIKSIFRDFFSKFLPGPLTLEITENNTHFTNLLVKTPKEMVDTWLNTPIKDSKMHDLPILFVARHGKPALVRELIKLGANPIEPNPHSGSQCNALFIAAQENYPQVIDIICGEFNYNSNSPRTSDTLVRWIWL